MNAHQMLDWLFLTGFMPLIRAALPNQSLPKFGTLFRQTLGRPLFRLTVHSNPDKLCTENEAFSVKTLTF